MGKLWVISFLILGGVVMFFMDGKEWICFFGGVYFFVFGCGVIVCFVDVFV